MFPRKAKSLAESFSPTRTYVLYMLVIALCFHGIGVFVFNDGFFLTREELSNQSSCSKVPSLSSWRTLKKESPISGEDDDIKTPSKPSNKANLKACWTDYVKFKRVIIVVIDALKYEFTEWKDLMGIDVHPYENKLPVIRDLLKRKPFNSFLVPFYADPPTTTLQRLKGLTTGGLPTFIEFKDDFAKDMDITEDNLMDLLVRSGKNLTFMGDDTWMSLYPNQFHRAFPFPSFDVKDLHTVDNGVMKHLTPELLRDDWDLLVAHFLGVDHVGHRFGPNHPAMESKLLQMNIALEELIRLMNSKGMADTALFVFGDHGMTDDGNHGGASPDEVGAALFVYSPQPILSNITSTVGHRKANQPKAKSDSELLFQEAVELLHDKETYDLFMKEGHRPVVQQIDLVPTLALLLGLPIPFGNLGMIVPELFFLPEAQTRYDSADSILHMIESFRNLNTAIEVNVVQVLDYLRSYQEKTSNSNAGVPLELLNEFTKKATVAFEKLHLVESTFTRGGHSNKTHEQLLKVHIETYYTSRDVLKRARDEGRKLWTQFNLRHMYFGIAMTALGSVISGAGMIYLFQFSNLYENENGSLLCGISILMLILQLAALFSNSFIVAEPNVVVFISVTFSTCFLFISLKQKHIDTKLVMATFLIAVSSRLSVALGPMQSMGQEAMKGDSLKVWFWVMGIFPLIIIGIIGVHSFPYIDSFGMSASTQKLLSKEHIKARVKAPEIIFIAQLLLTGSFWFCQTLGTEFNEQYHMFILYQARIVYLLAALGSVYVKYCKLSIVSNVIFLSSPMILLFGPASPLVYLLMTVQMISSAYVYEKVKVGSISLTIFWANSALMYFYATGHACTFDKIQVASTFVGFENYSWYRSAIMLPMNQLGVHLIHFMLLPFFLFRKSTVPKTDVDRKAWNQKLAFVLLTFCFVYSSRGLVTICFVTAARRHLMVWAIFAPKYIFDGIFMLAVDLVAIIVWVIYSYDFKETK